MKGSIGHIYNVGSGSEISIKELAELVQEITEHKGDIIWDINKPDGAPRKLMDSSKLGELGHNNSIDLKDGAQSLYKYYDK